MKSVIKNALILMAFTLVCGLALGLVYNITKDRIDEVNAQTLADAYAAVFADADSFESVEYDADEVDAILADAGYKDTIDDIESAHDADGEAMGYVFTVTATDGSQGSITFCVGIRNDGTLNGFSITDTSETPGLGLKASDDAFSGQFVDKQVDSFTVTTGTSSKDSEIEAITGATITSKAVTNGCNAALLYFNELEGGGDNE